MVDCVRGKVCSLWPSLVRLMRIRDLGWNYSALSRFAAWRVVPVVVIISVLPWPWSDDVPPLLFLVPTWTVLAVTLILLPLRPCLIVSKNQIQVKGMITTRRFDRRAINSVGMELRNSSFNRPTMCVTVRQDNTESLVHLVAIPDYLFERAVAAIDPSLFERWQMEA